MNQKLIGKEIYIFRNIDHGKIRSILFDFDGTISLIREGWQGVMISMMVDHLMKCPRHESEVEIEQIVKEYVTRLTGRQTIYQMIQLHDEIKVRGGKPLSPLEYKYQYLDALSERINYRIDGLEAGTIGKDEFMVGGSREFLEALRKMNVKLYLASGTDEKYVIQEAELLGIDGFFDSIYGAQDDYKNFSKKKVINHIIVTQNLEGNEFITFGDGYVEIEETKSVGGIAIGIASNEAIKKGFDQWKMKRLVEAGADIIMPDFLEYKTLLNFLSN
jgi:phosphoglycolate phosphatase-like HAD superfamily hydrolase